MPIGNTVGIRNKTIDITNKFFKDIKWFTPGKANYELQLYPRVEKFFLDMDKLGKKEFARYLRQQRYTCNISLNDIEDKIRNLDVFYCLVALIICHYSEIDVFFYFFPEEFTKRVERPTYSSDSWWIIYCFQMLSYWFSQVFIKNKYEVNTSTNDFLFIIEASRFVRHAMNNSYYLQLINSGPENLYSSHLYLLTAYILGVSTLDVKRTPDLSIPGDCRLSRWGIFSVSEQETTLENENTAGKSTTLMAP